MNVVAPKVKLHIIEAQTLFIFPLERKINDDIFYCFSLDSSLYGHSAVFTEKDNEKSRRVLHTALETIEK